MKKSIKIFDIINIFILSLFGIICVFPFVYEILISFSSKVDFYQSTFIVLPKHFTFIMNLL